jgi:pantoate--beta-alanine ligase
MMRTLHGCEGLRGMLVEARSAGSTIGFVPTMGNLHEGHLGLVRRAREKTDFVVASIFVNPFQFAEGEDYESYPRTPERDLAMLTEAGAHLVFLPTVADLYPNGAGRSTRIEVPELGTILCGRFRPQFFRGVATVVNILLNLVQPHVAVFGEKDYQQLLVIKQMVGDLRLPVEVVGVPTVRELDGLAMSSRNHYLSTEQRQRAPMLYKTLCAARDSIMGGCRDFRAIEGQSLESLKAGGFRPDYVCVRQADSLAEPIPGDSELVVMGATWLGPARLIDNVQIR